MNIILLICCLIILTLYLHIVKEYQYSEILHVYESNLLVIVILIKFVICNNLL